jgi:hypothetical protein
MSDELVPVEVIENRIYLIRGHKVMLDRELAFLYGVPTKVLNQAVKRNNGRFHVFPDKTRNSEDVTNCDFLNKS